MRWLLAFSLAIFYASAAYAQDDKDRITRFLEESLSSSGSVVQIEGFRGALSSRATLDKLSVADGEGVWLTLTDAVLDWNRAAILGGRIEINQISATQIELPRLPVSEPSVSPESGTFSLPDLPVSVRVDSIEVQRVVLGAPVLGVASTVSVDGSLDLEGGEGAAALKIDRLDGPSGVFNLAAEFSNVTRELALELTLDEAPNGLVANLLRLPDRPSVEISVIGNAPIDDFLVDVVLKSDGEERLAGQIGTQARAESSDINQDFDSEPKRRVNVDVAGDLTALFTPQYRPFFGPDVSVTSRISLFEDGRTVMDDLFVETAALQLAGRVALSADGIPDSFSLDGLLRNPSGSPVLLPLSGSQTWINNAKINARFDEETGNAWELTADVQGLQRQDVSIDQVQLSAAGLIERQGGPQITAKITGTANGIDIADAALAEALGSDLKFDADALWHDGQPLNVPFFQLSATGVEISGGGSLDDLDSAMTVLGGINLDVADLSRFSNLASRPMSGKMRADVNGSAALLTGEFDLDLNAVATNLGVGIAKVDGFLTGESSIEISAARNADGLNIEAGKLVAGTAVVDVSGSLATGRSDLAFNAAVENIERLVDGWTGPLQMNGRARENTVGWQVSGNATGPLASSIQAEIELPKNAPMSARLQGRIGAIGSIIPDLPGAAQFTADVRQQGALWAVNAQAQGPAGSNLSASGDISQSGDSAALDLAGIMPLELLNRRLTPNSMQGQARFDLQLNGPLALSSVTGQVRTTGARMALPGLRNALTDIDATATLSASRADIQANANAASGGRLSAIGRVALASPFSADGELQITDVIVTDNRIYETTTNGKLLISGSAQDQYAVSGRLALDNTDIRIQATGIGASGAIPVIAHLNEPATSRATRARAGLLEQAETDASGRMAIGLDVRVVAENRIFLRGRGLDAELGGAMQLTGTTTDVIPRGQFDLIRGRLDILGKRLELEEGSIRMQGDLNPLLRIVARTTSEDTTVRVMIEGSADAPEIQFTSEPELPSDEVLARLLFGRGIASLSALQAVQLASAVATLAGKGGEGIVERLRQNTGLDDLDVTTSEEGTTTLRAGKYISENVYSDVVVDGEGNSHINLNLDLSRSTTVRGQLGSDGGTGIGLFFEKDY